MNILIIDIETTGFMPIGKIVEVGIVELNLLSGDRKIIFDKICHEKPITLEEIEKAWIVRNSDLSAEIIFNSDEFLSMQSEIQEIINSYPLGATAYNNQFDFRFLEYRGIVFNKKLACPMKLSTDVCRLPGKRGFKWPTVEEAHRHFFGDLGYVEKHRGADDAMHEAKIVHELYKMGIFKVEEYK